jgi:protein-disulfide isomerase
MEQQGVHRVVAINADDHIRGPINAPVTLIEYGDFECPFCGMAYPVVKAIEKKYARQLCFAFRNFPLPQHPHAYAAAETSEFAEDYGRFWEMHDVLFENQRALDLPHLLAYAARLRLDPQELAEALRQGVYRALIEQVKEEGEAAGVVGTPTFFLNGLLFQGEPTIETFSEAIDWLLARKAVR